MKLESLDDAYFADVDEYNGAPGRFAPPPEIQQPELDPLATGDLGVDTTTDVTFPEMLGQTAGVIAEAPLRGLKGMIDLPKDIESLLRGVVEAYQDPNNKGIIDSFMQGMQDQTLLPGADELAQMAGAKEFPHATNIEAAQKVIGMPGEMIAEPAAMFKVAKVLKGVPKEVDELVGLARNLGEGVSKQTPEAVKGNLVKAFAGNDPWKRVCHKGACEAIADRGIKKGDKFLLLTPGENNLNTVAHTVLVDKNNKILGDTMSGKIENGMWKPTDQTPKNKALWEFNVSEEVDAKAVEQAATKYKQEINK